MPVNPNFSSQGAQVPGGYAQPAAGVTEQIDRRPIRQCVRDGACLRRYRHS